MFPKEHWTVESPQALENPPEFDFIGNAVRVGAIMAEYRERANDDIHGQSWAEDFMKTYEVGRRLQELGLHPNIAIG